MIKVDAAYQYHDHTYCGCKHELGHCQVCDIVYCRKCGKEWGRYYKRVVEESSPWKDTIANPIITWSPINICGDTGTISVGNTDRHSASSNGSFSSNISKLVFNTEGIYGR